MHPQPEHTPPAYLWAELLTLFIAAPTVFALWRLFPDPILHAAEAIGIEASWLAKPNRFMLPLLMLCTVACFITLLRDPRFERKQLWNARAAVRSMPAMLVTFAICASLLTLLTWQLSPDSWLMSTLNIAGLGSRWLPGIAALFVLPNERPTLWVLIMILYPLLSVWPQEVLYRSFLHHRYAPILNRRSARIAVSAFAFGYMHIVFLNVVAPALCLLGGLLFAITYERTRSLLAASIEHALYGCWVFTVGLGAYFYGGTVYG